MEFYYQGPNEIKDPVSGKLYREIKHGRYDDDARVGRVHLASLEVCCMVDLIYNAVFQVMPTEMVDFLNDHGLDYQVHVDEDFPMTICDLGSAGSSVRTLYVSVDEVVLHGFRHGWTLSDATLDYVTPYIIKLVCGGLNHPNFTDASKAELKDKVFSELKWTETKISA